MKDICQAVYEKLCSDSSISRYVCGRIYPIILPEDTPLPAIVYTPVLANYDWGYGLCTANDAVCMPRYDIQKSTGTIP